MPKGSKHIQAITLIEAENHKCTSQIRTFHQPYRFCTSAFYPSIRLSFPIHTTTLIPLCSTSARKSRKTWEKERQHCRSTKIIFVFCPFLRMTPLTLPASNLCTRRMGCPESTSSFHIISLSLGCRLYHPSPPMQKLPCLGFPFLSG